MISSTCSRGLQLPIRNTSARLPLRFLSTSSSTCGVLALVSRTAVANGAEGFLPANDVRRARRRMTNRPIQIQRIRHYSPGQANPRRKEEEDDVPTTTTTAEPAEPSTISSVEQGTTTGSSLVRPTISPSFVPFLSPSALDSPHPHAPPTATSTIREAIADYLEAEKAGHVQAPGPEVTSTWRILYFRAKQLFKFYWAGLKLLKTNVQDMRALQKGRKLEGWDLTRRELRFVERTQGDLIRLVPFVVLLATLEELLPLMVLYSPWMLPTATILPSQLLRIKAAEEERRRGALLELGKHIKGISQGTSPKGVQDLDSLELNQLCRALDLGNFAPDFWLRRRLSSRLE
jgi:LETM1 and EF-hand domain-containing protein 1